MEQYRISYKNKINLEIKDLKKFIEKDEKTLKRLVDKTDDFSTRQKDKCTKSISEKKDRICFLENEIILCNTGQLDDKLKNTRVKNAKEAKVNTNTKDKSLLIKNNQKKEGIEYIKQQHKKDREQSQYERNFNKEVNRGYYHYLKCVNKVANYQKKNLKDMPTNKGYIINGGTFNYNNTDIVGKLYVYGKQNPVTKKNNITMFEKIDKENMLIHEWSQNNYKIFKKQGKNNKKLISREKRKQKNFNIL